jgi:hypothetical protein
VCVCVCVFCLQTCVDAAGMALGWLEKMLWVNPSQNITVVSMGYDLGGSRYCGEVYMPGTGWCVCCCQPSIHPSKKKTAVVNSTCMKRLVFAKTSPGNTIG